MKKIPLLVITILCFVNANYLIAQELSNYWKNRLVCNPMNLSYRYRPETKEASRREAADPVIVLYKDLYILFASKTGGYWISNDLIKWDLVLTNQIPTEDYAPTVVEINDTLYFMASAGTNAIYKSANPESGNWIKVRDSMPMKMTDPAFFLDDDKRLYLYWGCSNKDPLYRVELDMARNFEPIGNFTKTIFANPKKLGWEGDGDYNQSDKAPWIEGSWMNKINGTYYLQYAAPGTEYRSYCDAVYTSKSPLGPFNLAMHNPFSLKIGGFIGGAGHGSTFKDKYGNYWHVATMTISIHHPFERRLGLFPVFVDNDSLIYTNTAWGDFPMQMPDRKISTANDIFTDYMLLSNKKTATASSSMEGHEPSKAVDENIRTAWAAKTGDKGEWFIIDLEAICKVAAIQVNYFDINSKTYGRDSLDYYQYLVEYSQDGKVWNNFSDKRNSKESLSHNFLVADKLTQARYLKITNYKIPGGVFALSGLRVFGYKNGKIPSVPDKVTVLRNEKDKRKALIKWEPVRNASGYNINYGISPEKLYHNHYVFGVDSLFIGNLHDEKKYYFKIQSFNESGRSKLSKMVLDF